MTDLKPYFDRAKTDSDDVIRLTNEVNILFNNGADEGIQAAIDLQPALDAAVTKAEGSNKLYIAMRNADGATSNAASLFVSSDASHEEAQEDEKKLTLAAFNALVPKERMKFLEAGGRLED